MHISVCCSFYFYNGELLLFYYGLLPLFAIEFVALSAREIYANQDHSSKKTVFNELVYCFFDMAVYFIAQNFHFNLMVSKALCWLGVAAGIMLPLIVLFVLNSLPGILCCVYLVYGIIMFQTIVKVNLDLLGHCNSLASCTIIIYAKISAPKVCLRYNGIIYWDLLLRKLISSMEIILDNFFAKKSYAKKFVKSCIEIFDKILWTFYCNKMYDVTYFEDLQFINLRLNHISSIRNHFNTSKNYFSKSSTEN